MRAGDPVRDQPETAELRLHVDCIFPTCDERLTGTDSYILRAAVAEHVLERHDPDD